MATASSSTSSSSLSKISTDLLTQLSNILPTGTFLVFQVLAPLATNNGACGTTEKIVTAVTLTLLGILCAFSSFTDSYKGENGTVYYGLVTRKGLWNPHFKLSGLTGCTKSTYTGGGKRYLLHRDDFINATLSVVALATLTLLTTPVTTCYYPQLPSSVVKTVPLLVGLVVSVICAFGTTSRHGVGFAVAATSSNTESLLRTSSMASIKGTEIA